MSTLAKAEAVIKKCHVTFKEALITESLGTFYGHFRVYHIPEPEVDNNLLDEADSMYIMGGEL